MKHHLPHLNFIFLTLSLFFLSFGEKTFAATIIELNVKQPAKIGACRSNSFSIAYFHATAHYFSIDANLTASGNPVNTACDTPAVHANVFIKIDSIVNSSLLYYKTDSIGHDYRWKAHLAGNSGDSIKIYYRILIDCANLSDSAGAIPNSVLNQTFTDSSGVNDYHVNGSSLPSLVSSSIFTPYIQNNSPAAYNVYYLDTLEALFTYTNTGAFDANISFRFFPDNIQSCMSNYLTLEYADSAGGNFTTLVPGSLTHTIIKQGKSLLIKQRFFVDNCFSNCGTGEVTLTWQCNLPESSSNFCPNCQKVFTSSYYFNVADNNQVNVTLISPAFPASIQWDHSCLNDIVNENEWVYRITKPYQGALDSLYIIVGHYANVVTFPYELSLIRPSTVFIDTNCFNCSVDTQLVTTNLSLCSGTIGPSIDSIKIFVTRFRAGDTLYVHYKLYRCAEENDAVLMNKPKFYNNWSISAGAETICGDSSAYDAYSASGKLDQSIFFLPVTSDLSVPHDSVFGEKARFNIDLKGLVAPYPHAVISGLLGCQADTCTWNGYLKAKVFCDYNLRIARPDSDVYLVLFDTSTFTPLMRYPAYYHYSLALDSCEPGYYYFYFPLQDSLTHQIMNHGRFSFQLQACCKIDTSQSKYKISFYLIANPGDPSCFNIVFADTINHVQPPLCNGANCPSIPLSDAEDAIQVHCPGCLAPGIIVDGYKMRRESYGLQDSDNDERADSSLTQITSASPWYNTFGPLLDLSSSAFGDLLTDRLTAHFEPGSPSEGGYSYAQMQPGGGWLNHIQLYRSVPYALDTVKLELNDFTFYIDEPNTGQPNCISCPEFGVDPSKYRTQQVINVTGANISNFIITQTSGGKYLYTFSSMHDAVSLTDSGNLHNTALYNSFFIDTLSPFLTFFEGQRYRLKVNYRQCGIFQNFASPNDINAFIFKSKIFNKMALCGKQNTIPEFEGAGQMPNSDSLIHTLGYTVDPADTLLGDTLINGYFAGKHLFYCETFSGRHFFFQDYVITAGGLHFAKAPTLPTPLDTNCTIVMEAYGLDYIAVHGYEMTPYEYRPALLAPVEFRFAIPTGYYVDTVYTRTAFSYNNKAAYSNMLGIAHPAYPNDTLIFYKSDLPPLACLAQNVSVIPSGTIQIVGNPNDFNQYAGDRILSRELYVVCKTTLCNDTAYRFNDSTILVFMDTAFTSCFALPNCGLDPRFKGITYMGNNQGNKKGKDIMILPNLELVDSTGHAYKETFCTKLKLTNRYKEINGYNSTHASNVFIAIPDSASVPYLTGWTFTFNGNSYSPDSNGIIHMSAYVEINDSIEGNLCAYFTACHATDSVKIYYGWNCNGFPHTISPGSVCFIDSVYYPFVPGDAVLGTNGKDPNPVHYNLCDTFEIVIPYSSSNSGGVRPDSVFLYSVPDFLTVTDVLIGNTGGTKASLSAAATPNTWRIKGADLYAVGFTDTVFYSPAYTVMNLIIKAFAGCGYNGSPVSPVILFAHKYCGDPLILPTTCDPYIPDSNYCTDCFTVTKTALADTVILNDTMSFKIKICGNNSSAQYVTINELLPDTVTSNFVLTGTIPPFLLIPAQGCDSFLVTGYFTTPGPATDTNHINKVEITTANSIVFESSDSVTVMSSCYDPSYIVIQDSTFASSLAGKNYANDTLLINNRFYIDVDTFTLTHCLVYTEPGAQIIVLPGSLLILDSTDVIACTSMWRGILMKNDSKVLIKNRSRLHDAENGVFIDGNSRLDVLNSYILDCVTGIYVDPNSGLSGSNVFIKGSSFGLNAAAFKDKYQGQPSHGAWPKTGIEINNVSVITIGDNSFAPNRFFKSSVGILARQSGLTVKNSLFESIYADTAYHRPFEGTALVGYGSKSDAIASHLTVSPQVATTPMVQNSYRGIYTNYSSLWVNSVKFVNLYAGVYSIRCSDLLKSQVSNCYMEVKRFGIYWIHNQGSGGMIADNDTIKVRFGYSDPALHLNSGAIMLIEKNIDAQVNYSVFDNTIEIDSAKRGIWANGVHRPNITHNKISVSGACTGGMEGVSINGCDRAAVTCNIINGLYPADTSRVRGINTNECQHSAIVCNHTDSTYRGVFFGGFNPGTKFRGNEMFTHFEGLFLNKAAVIDTQAHAGNKWWGPFTAYGGVNMNNTFGGLNASEFIIDPGLNPEYFFSFPFPQNLGWVFADSGNTFDCNWVISPFCNPISTELRAELIERMIAEDSLSTVDFNDESQVKAMIYLYGRLMNDSALLASDEIFRAFLEEHSEGPIGYLYEVGQEIMATAEYDSTFTALISHAYNLRQLYSDSLENIDYYIQHSIPYTSEEYMLNQIAFLEQTISNLVIQRNGFTEGYFNSAELVNDLVIPEGIPDANETLINEVEIQFEENGDDGEYALTTYYNDILGVAQQCPYSGGKAVYKARAYVAMVNDTIEYDDETACLLVGIYKSSDKAKSKANRVQLIPNPANETVKVIFNNPDAKICNIKIYNAINEKVFSMKFDCKEKEASIDIRSLVPGAYTVKINMDNAESQMKKLVIIR